MMNTTMIKYLQTGVIKYGNEKRRMRSGQEDNVSTEFGAFLIEAGYAEAVKKPPDKTENVGAITGRFDNVSTPEETATPDVLVDDASENAVRTSPVSRKRKKDDDNGAL